MRRAMMNESAMTAAACAEAAFSCADKTAMTMDAALLASILFAILGLGLRLRSLICLLGLHIFGRLKVAAPIFA